MRHQGIERRRSAGSVERLDRLGHSFGLPAATRPSGSFHLLTMHNPTTPKPTGFSVYRGHGVGEESPENSRIFRPGLRALRLLGACSVVIPTGRGPKTGKCERGIADFVGVAGTARFRRSSIIADVGTGRAGHVDQGGSIMRQTTRRNTSIAISGAAVR